MAWLTTLSSANQVYITPKNDYYEERTDPNDNTKSQKRARRTVVYEYRGLDKATAEANAGASFTLGEFTMKVAQRDGEGGAYTLTVTVDTILGAWFTVSLT